MKPFNLEAAREGKPVCTRDGRPARIICFDRKSSFPIVANIEDHGIEITQAYDNKGKFSHQEETNSDLMMATEKKQGWINIYRQSINGKVTTQTGIVYSTKEDAIISKSKLGDYLATVPIEWEE